jgi:hypothetical protein
MRISAKSILPNKTKPNYRTEIIQTTENNSAKLPKLNKKAVSLQRIYKIKRHNVQKKDSRQVA